MIHASDLESSSWCSVTEARAQASDMYAWSSSRPALCKPSNMPDFSPSTEAGEVTEIDQILILLPSFHHKLLRLIHSPCQFLIPIIIYHGGHIIVLVPFKSSIPQIRQKQKILNQDYLSNTHIFLLSVQLPLLVGLTRSVSHPTTFYDSTGSVLQRTSCVSFAGDLTKTKHVFISLTGQLVALD